MSTFRFKAPDIPFLLSGDNALVTDLLRGDDEPLEPSDEPIAALEFQPDGVSGDMQLGKSGSLTLGVDAETSVQLSAIWPTTADQHGEVLELLGLDEFFANGGQDQLVVLLQVGGALDASVSAGFRYSVLKADASLKAGADGTFATARAFPLDTPARVVLTDFFRDIRLPAAVEVVPEPGQAVVLDYGGYLKFGASVKLGYEMSGSASHELGRLSLSERLNVDLFAQLGIAAELAGRFNVLVSAGSKPGWARVRVRKHREKSLAIAADVSVGLDLVVDGLPGSKDKFLGSLLGLRTQNWLNLFSDAQKFTDFEQLDAHLDTLAKKYIEELTGEVFDKLAESDAFTGFLDHVNEIIDSYQNLETHTIAILDRYFDPVAGKLDSAAAKALKFIDRISAIDELAGQILPDEVSDVLFLLTDGDPLGWLAGRVEIAGEVVDGLEELKRRIGQVSSLATDTAHAKIREVVSLAKSNFPLDQFLTDLDDIDLPTLKQQADQRLGGFAERLVGRSLEGLSNSELGKVVTEIHETLDSIDDFTDQVYAKVRAALNQSLELKLHASYNRASESDDLIDLDLNLKEEEGRRLMRRAGLGDFGPALVLSDPEIVRLNSGTLTDRFTQERSVAFNVVGWHDGWHYNSMRRLITRSEQHIRSEEGLVTISTELELELDRERNRNGEKIFTNFLLGMIGHTTGAAKFDEETGRYLVDTIERMSASYSLGFEDADTEPKELFRYLSFADDFGLVESDAAARAAIEPLLPRDDEGHFGWTSVCYEARFSEQALKAAFGVAFDGEALRRTMREIVLANYMARPHMKAIGWAYWTPGLYSEFKRLGSASFSGRSGRVVPHASPFREAESPHKVTLDRSDFRLLSTLYLIEDRVVKAFETLSKLIAGGEALSPREYAKALRSLGQALESYDKFDAFDNTIFAILDGLTAAAGHDGVRNSRLTISSRVGDREVKKMLVA